MTTIKCKMIRLIEKKYISSIRNLLINKKNKYFKENVYFVNAKKFFMNKCKKFFKKYNK